MEEGAEIDLAVWDGGPHDGEEIGIPRGCRVIHHVISTYADGDQFCISEHRTTVPVEATEAGLRIRYYKARTEGAIEE